MSLFENMRARARLTLAAGLLATAGMAAWAPAAATTAAPLDEVYSVTYPVNFYFSDYVADKKGFFTEEGLKVTFITPQNGVNAVQLMASGQIAFMINDGVLTLLAQSRGLGLTMIGSMYNRSAWSLYVADKDEELSGTAQTNPGGFNALKGKRIGITGINAGMDLGLQGLLKSNGLDPDKDVRRIGIGLISSAIGQFENGGIDAYVYGHPADDLLGKDKLAHRYFTFVDADPVIANFVQGGMVASTKWLNTGNNREIAQRWITAQRKALDWIRNPDNLQEAGELFASVLGGTVEGGIKAVQELNETVYTHNHKDLKVPRTEFANSVQQLQSLGMFTDKAPTYEEAVDSMGRE